MLSDAECSYCSLKRAARPCYKQVKPQLQAGCMENSLVQWLPPHALIEPLHYIPWSCDLAYTKAPNQPIYAVVSPQSVAPIYNQPVNDPRKRTYHSNMAITLDTTCIHNLLFVYDPSHSLRQEEISAMSEWS